MKIKVLSYNIHKGRAFFSRKRTWHVLDELLHQTEPDIVFLQEFLAEPESEKLLEKLADHLWPHSSLGKNATVGDYHYGNAILSKFPFQKTHNTDITNHILEKRGLLFGKVDLNKSQSLSLFCSHLDLTYKSRIKQIKKIESEMTTLTANNDAVLFCADLNDWDQKLHRVVENSLSLKEVFESLGSSLPLTSPSILPMLPLDRIYYRGLMPLSAQIINSRHLRTLSDHLPVMAEFVVIDESK